MLTDQAMAELTDSVVKLKEQLEHAWGDVHRLETLSRAREMAEASNSSKQQQGGDDDAGGTDDDGETWFMATLFSIFNFFLLFFLLKLFAKCYTSIGMENWGRAEHVWLNKARHFLSPPEQQEIYSLAWLSFFIFLLLLLQSPITNFLLLTTYFSILVPFAKAPPT